ncbi:MAG: hypothetical protein M5U35_14995 [Roseovarius sp.]|nr:hypothetical protein [Roseovarius sp.]
MQAAFAALFGHLPPKERVGAARRVLERLPEGHPFKSNPNLNDHKSGDAGFYDLLLHSQDRAYDVPALIDVLDRTGWRLSGFTVPALYDPARFAEVPEGLDGAEAMALAERLAGTIRTHTGYAVAKDSAHSPASGRNRALVPHLMGVEARALAQTVARAGQSMSVHAASPRRCACRVRRRRSLPPSTGGRASVRWPREGAAMPSPLAPPGRRSRPGSPPGDAALFVGPALSLAHAHVRRARMDGAVRRG